MATQRSECYQHISQNSSQIHCYSGLQPFLFSRTHQSRKSPVFAAAVTISAVSGFENAEAMDSRKKTKHNIQFYSQCRVCARLGAWNFKLLGWMILASRNLFLENEKGRKCLMLYLSSSNVDNFRSSCVKRYSPRPRCSFRKLNLNQLHLIRNIWPLHFNFYSSLLVPQTEMITWVVFGFIFW